VLTNLAASLFSQNKPEEAIAFARQALELSPGNPQAMLVVADSLALQHRFAESLEILERIVADMPDDAEAWAAAGTVRTQLKRYAEAVPAYRRALTIRPDFDFVRGNLVSVRMHAGDWAGLEADWEALLAGVRQGLPVARPFDLVAIPCAPADQLACARTCIAHEYPACAPLWRGERYAHDRIRVAYVCADFGGLHPINQVLVGLFEQHDHGRFKTIAVATRPSDTGPLRQRVAGAFDQFIEAGDKSDRELAELLRRLEVDIAVDLNGHTANNRLATFAMRPAPIQVSYIAFPGTMGADFIDYLIADPVVLPAADRPHYSEKLVHLPASYYMTDDRAPTPDVETTRAEYGLPDQGFVFCCFNNSYKVTADVFDVWMGLLGAVAGSVLWLLDSAPAFGANLRRQAEARGVSPARLIFAPHMPLAAHLARHRHADLFLDTFHCNAHTTACDALWMGLPVLTCPGTTFAGRVAASLLTAVGMPELIAPSADAYAARALELATTPVALAEVRARLAANRLTHPLFNTKRQTRHVEAAYEGMMARHRAGAPPEDFAVSPLP
jgi:protein O-GlcNAc transferase